MNERKPAGGLVILIIYLRNRFRWRVGPLGNGPEWQHPDYRWRSHGLESPSTLFAFPYSLQLHRGRTGPEQLTNRHRRPIMAICQRLIMPAPNAAIALNGW